MVLLTVSTVAVVLLGVALGPAICTTAMSSCGPTLGIFGVVASAIGFGIASLTYGARIKLSSGSFLGMSETKTLSVLGTGHSGRIYIPVPDIGSIKNYDYNEPVWRSLFLPFSKQAEAGGHVINLPGYRGPGLEVTYSHSPLLGSDVTTSKLVFPTRNPERIRELLGDK